MNEQELRFMTNLFSLVKLKGLTDDYPHIAEEMERIINSGNYDNSIIFRTFLTKYYVNGVAYGGEVKALSWEDAVDRLKQRKYTEEVVGEMDTKVDKECFTKIKEAYEKANNTDPLRNRIVGVENPDDYLTTAAEEYPNRLIDNCDTEVYHGG